MSSRFDKSARIPVAFTTPAPAPATVPVPANRPLDPADANSDWHWLDCMRRAGFLVVRAEVEFGESPPQTVGTALGERVGERLENEGLGHFDSIRQGDPFYLYFYLTYRTQEGINLIRACLGEIGLAQLSLLTVADAQAKAWLPAPKEGASA